MFLSELGRRDITYRKMENKSRSGTAAVLGMEGIERIHMRGIMLIGTRSPMPSL
jgi:hypothetical protein